MKSRNDSARTYPKSKGASPQRACRRTSQWWRSSLGRGLGPQAAWVQRHLANCPRCRRRVAALGKVEMALRVVKTQPHRLDLLRRANAEAVKMLKHDLRNAPQARVLKDSEPEPSLLERSGRYRHWATNVAACLAIALLTKSGLFASLGGVTARGEELVQQYYTSQVGEELAQEIFDA